jgi:hypothetical protein
MPIPKPNSSESQNDFIKRCMSDEKMMSEYTDIDQRFSICITSYENTNLNEVGKSEKNMGSSIKK